MRGKQDDGISRVVSLVGVACGLALIVGGVLAWHPWDGGSADATPDDAALPVSDVKAEDTDGMTPGLTDDDGIGGNSREEDDSSYSARSTTENSEKYAISEDGALYERGKVTVYFDKGTEEEKAREIVYELGCQWEYAMPETTNFPLTATVSIPQGTSEEAMISRFEEQGDVDDCSVHEVALYSQGGDGSQGKVSPRAGGYDRAYNANVVIRVSDMGFEPSSKVLSDTPIVLSGRR